MADLLWDAEVGPGQRHGPWTVLHRILTGRGHLTNSAHEVQLSAHGGLVQSLVVVWFRVSSNRMKNAPPCWTSVMSSLLHGAGFPPVTSSVVVDVVASGGAGTSPGGLLAAFASLCASCSAHEIPPLESLPTHNAASEAFYRPWPETLVLFKLLLNLHPPPPMFSTIADASHCRGWDRIRRASLREGAWPRWHQRHRRADWSRILDLAEQIASYSQWHDTNHF